MRLIHTAVLFDRGPLVTNDGWRQTYEAYAQAIGQMVNPTDGDDFALRARTRKVDSKGKVTTQWHRNGVKPIKQQFYSRMETLGWRSEESLDLSPFFQSDQVRPYRLYTVTSNHTHVVTTAHVFVLSALGE